MEETQKKARDAAGALAGEYLEVVGKTDIMQFTSDEFDMLILTVVEGYRDAMTELCQPF